MVSLNYNINQRPDLFGDSYSIRDLSRSRSMGGDDSYASSSQERPLQRAAISFSSQEATELSSPGYERNFTSLGSYNSEQEGPTISGPSETRYI